MKSLALLLTLLTFLSFQCISQIDQKYQEMGGEKGILGKPIVPHRGNSKDGGQFQRYQKGMILWHPSTGAHAVYGVILDKYRKLNWEHGVLGFPTSDVMKTPDGKGEFCTFQGGNIYWTKKTKAWVVKGPILDKWGELGFEKGFLGYPVAEGKMTPDTKGRFQVFEHGSIYFSDETPPCEIHGEIRKKWGKLKYENGVLGYPITDELRTPDNSGRFQRFQHGHMYWSPNTGAHYINREILRKYGDYNYEQGVLGYPVEDVEDCPNTGGRSIIFENGCIVWSKATGAHALYGKLKIYCGCGYGYLGFPTSDVMEIQDGEEGGVWCQFENGKVLWTPSLGDNRIKEFQNETGEWKTFRVVVKR